MILLPTERKTWKARLILGAIYLLLCLGAFTMIYPFLMMLSGSMAGRYDYHRYSPVLGALWTPEGRLMRVLASYHAAFPHEVFPEAPANWNNWTAIARDPAAVKTMLHPWLQGLQQPETRAAWLTMAQDYADFNRTYDLANSVCAYDERDIAPYVRSVFEERTGHQGEAVALAALNREWPIRYASFYGIRFRSQARVPLHYVDWDWPKDDPKVDMWQAFKAHYRAEDLYYTRTRPYLLAPVWNAWRARQGLSAAPFPGDATDPAWQRFVTTAYPRRLLRLEPTPALETRWHAWLHQQCKTPADYARLTGEAAPERLEDLPLLPYQNSLLWRGFVATLPYAELHPLSAEAQWQAFLQQRYGTLERLNALYRDRTGQPLAATDWREVPLPMAQAFIMTYEAHAFDLLTHDLFANYRTVFDLLFCRAQAWWNTLVLVVLTLLATLTVNPLAAYALSRFRLRHTEGLLLFLLATMAFPAAVTAIPGFLLIRELGLLNTFAALVLPTVANGLSIFILKGFFDALPRELYEAATIDGAGEWHIFRHITLPMTTPILAVNALNAFIAAYNSWEWALLVCQKQSHWTLSVWLYQMSRQFAATPWVVMSGFVIVSIPTALVFLFCQRIILRGIVLPTMK